MGIAGRLLGLQARGINIMIERTGGGPLHCLIRAFRKPDGRFANAPIYGVILLCAVSEGYLLTWALQTGKLKTRILAILLPVIVFMMTLFQRVRIQVIIAVLLLALWVPIGLYERTLFLFEACIYTISFLLIVRFPRRGDEKRADGDRLGSFLVHFPWFAFTLYILGALLTWRFSVRIFGEIDMIRIQCVFPLALSLVMFVSVRATEDAERLLWALLTSAAILALVFLVGRYIFPRYITAASYAAGSGRLSMALAIPHQLGSMEMLPQRTSNVYGYLLVFAYSLWVFHHSFLHRTYALLLCLLFGCIIITTQGRGGAITAGLGAAIISVYATFSRKLLHVSGVWIKFAVVSLAVIGGLWYLSVHSTNVYFYQHGISLFADPQQDENLLGRYQRWSDGIQLLMANPILGTGLRGYETPWGLDTSEVLNVFLYTVLSFGVLGFVGFLWILLKFLAAFRHGILSRDQTTRMMCIASLCGMLGFFFGLQSLEPYSMVLLWTPLVLAFAASGLGGNRSVGTLAF